MTLKQELSQREIEYIRKHTLTPEQLKQLVRDKLERAERMRMHSKIQERKQIYT
jgi:hypothetical protein